MRRTKHPTQARWSRRFERAASLVEYALLIALIALALITAVQFLGDSTSDSIDSSTSSLFG